MTARTWSYGNLHFDFNAKRCTYYDGITRYHMNIKRELKKGHEPVWWCRGTHSDFWFESFASESIEALYKTWLKTVLEEP